MLSTSPPRSTSTGPSPTFRHEALAYENHQEFVAWTAHFVRDGVDRNEPVMVAVEADKIDPLRRELGRHADGVHFVDARTVGNPARIIPAWRDFMDRQAEAERPVRAVSEPAYPGRSADELAECEVHEALLNLALGDTRLWLVCLRDQRSMAEAAAAELRNHPFVRHGDSAVANPHYRPITNDDGGPLSSPLPAPPTHQRLRFGSGSLSYLRRYVRGEVVGAGLTGARADDLVLAVSEAAANSVMHGGGQGELLVWHTDETVVCEIRDRGHVSDPLAGRVRPLPGQPDGRGLWIVNAVCDLVQMRSSAAGSVIRMHQRIVGPSIG